MSETGNVREQKTSSYQELGIKQNHFFEKPSPAICDDLERHVGGRGRRFKREGHVCSLSSVCLFVTPWTVDCQALLFTARFSRDSAHHCKK